MSLGSTSYEHQRMEWMDPFICKTCRRLAFVVGRVCIRAGKEDIKSDVDGFRQSVQPLLEKYCVDCHGPDKQKGDMRLDEIDPDVVRGTNFDQWEGVRESFNSGEMPPEDKPQPTDAERDLLTRWMDAEFKKVKLHGSTKKRGRSTVNAL